MQTENLPHSRCEFFTFSSVFLFFLFLLFFFPLNFAGPASTFVDTVDVFRTILLVGVTETILGKANAQ